MQKITPFLTYNDQVEEAANFYVSVFKNAKINNINRFGDTVMSASFELEGQEFLAMNGGPSFTFAQGFSLFVSCETQAEVDELWEKLTADGGAPGPCGWLTDKFGISWQIIPTALGQLMGDPDPRKSNNVMQAMLKMSKIEIAALKQAHEQA